MLARAIQFTGRKGFFSLPREHSHRFSIKDTKTNCKAISLSGGREQCELNLDKEAEYANFIRLEYKTFVCAKKVYRSSWVSFDL